jgi:hypothetical protein
MLVVSFDVGIKNLAFAVARVDAVVEVERWGSVCVCPTNARALTKQQAVELVVRALDELDFLACDTVLVESQPRFAPQNVHVAHAISTYFIVRKRADLDEPVAVHFVHASLKNALSARVLGADRPKLDPTCTVKYAKYARNKRQAIAACEALVARDETLRGMWDGFAKKDDGADALLQMVAWSRVATVTKKKPEIPTEKKNGNPE